MAQKPVDKEVAHRFAELVGLGCTQQEAAGAVAIGTRTGERLMTRPEIRQIVEETRARCGMGEGDPGIRALLEATDVEGNPAWERRVKGVELALEQLAGESGRGQGLLPGCELRLIMPLPDEQPLGTPSG